MGTRANVKWINDVDDNVMYFYQHYDGYDLPKIVASALDRGRDRWTDDQYLARIVFSEMISPSVLGNTGWGLSTYLGDGDDRVIIINSKDQTVTDFNNVVYTFQGFIDAYGN